MKEAVDDNFKKKADKYLEISHKTAYLPVREASLYILYIFYREF
jgi:hypothetical protein